MYRVDINIDLKSRIYIKNFETGELLKNPITVTVHNFCLVYSFRMTPNHKIY